VPESGFRGLLAEVLAAVSHDAPELFRGAGAALGEVDVALEVGDEAFRFETGADGGPVCRDAVDREPRIRLETRADAVVELVDGRSDLLDSVLDGTVRVRGDADAVASLDAALRCLVVGAVRSDRAERAWNRYAVGVRAASDRGETT
jgi:hypothetical protein